MFLPNIRWSIDTLYMYVMAYLFKIWQKEGTPYSLLLPLHSKLYISENKPKKEMIQILVKRGFDSDPIKAWKEAQQKLEVM